MKTLSKLIMVAIVAAVALGGNDIPLFQRESQTASLISPSSTTVWTAQPSDGIFSTAGFGATTEPSGSGDTYVGNVGRPYGSNIIIIPRDQASKYKYIAKFTGPPTEESKVVIWNKIGPDGKMDGWYGNACCSFTLEAGQTEYVAFAPDSNGGWATSKTRSIPIDRYGRYASTWGEFDFGSVKNDGWSGFDVSAILAQHAQLEVQGMQICSALNKSLCSYITNGASVVHNAYTVSTAALGGIGGNLLPGPVRLAVDIGFGE
jgi:hypothetical protein